MKLIDKYRLEETNEEEQSTITKALIQNKFDQNLRHKMAKRLEEQYGVRRIPKQRGRYLQLLYWGGSIAAAVLIGLALWPFSSPQMDYQALTAEYLAEFTPSNEWRKGSEDITELRAEAIQAYNTRDFVRAIELRTRVTASEKAMPEDFFYLGLSYLYQDNPAPEEGVTALQQVLRFPGNRLKEESKWYLSLALIQAAQLPKARALLEDIVANEQWNATKASTLLERIPVD